MGRPALAGLAGGVVVFAWSAIAHMALPLGETGIRSIPNEERVLQAIRAGVTVVALIEQAIGWTLAGLVIALILRGRRA